MQVKNFQCASASSLLMPDHGNIYDEINIEFLNMLLLSRKVQKEERGSHEGDYEEYKVCFTSYH